MVSGMQVTLQLMDLPTRFVAGTITSLVSASVLRHAWINPFSCAIGRPMSRSRNCRPTTSSARKPQRSTGDRDKRHDAITNVRDTFIMTWPGALRLMLKRRGEAGIAPVQSRIEANRWMKSPRCGNDFVRPLCIDASGN